MGGVGDMYVEERSGSTASNKSQTSTWEIPAIQRHYMEGRDTGNPYFVVRLLSWGIDPQLAQ